MSRSNENKKALGFMFSVLLLAGPVLLEDSSVAGG
jgi:hypothetical protein